MVRTHDLLPRPATSVDTGDDGVTREGGVSGRDGCASLRLPRRPSASDVVPVLPFPAPVVPTRTPLKTFPVSDASSRTHTGPRSSSGPRRDPFLRRKCTVSRDRLRCGGEVARYQNLFHELENPRRRHKGIYTLPVLLWQMEEPGVLLSHPMTCNFWEACHDRPVLTISVPSSSSESFKPGPISDLWLRHEVSVFLFHCSLLVRTLHNNPRSTPVTLP